MDKLVHVDGGLTGDDLSDGSALLLSLDVGHGY